MSLPNVFFAPVPDAGNVDEVRRRSRAVLSALLETEKIGLEKQIPLKLHFGERGNFTFLKPELYDGVIDELEARGSSGTFTETSVLYGGERFNRERHVKLAHSHGFTRLPVEIADGANGEESTEIPLHLKHFKSASIARTLAAAPQTLVLSHFKGHMLAGFGGAIKQLSMGFASKGGKMAMHMGVKPQIRRWKCRRCKRCVERCHADAIRIDEHPHIDHAKCIGCGACFAICPFKAISVWSLAGLKNALFGGKIFREKLVEYAYAAHTGKRNIYMNFALTVTRGCDCEPHPMRPCVPDIGIFASLDPVAADAACYEAAAKLGKKFRGAEQLDYAEKCRLGSRAFHLVELENETADTIGR